MRPRDGRLLAGVAAGVARRIGIDPLIVRGVFVLLTAAGGSGVLLYLIGWLVIPGEAAGGRDRASRTFGRDSTARAVAVAMVVVGALLLVRELGLWFDGRLVWPAALAAAGLAVAWDDEGAGGRVRSAPFATGRAGFVRVVVGALLVLAGIGSFLAASDALGAVSDSLVAAGAAIVGLGLMFGPWWWRLAQDLAEERRERIRSEERAAMAARVHDSVLQTLALIQRRAGDPTEVARLARRQERELRGWLYDPPAAGPGSLRERLAAMCADVEDLHGVSVELVAVGDCPVGPGMDAIVDAGREALVNAAKFSGVADLSAYVEVEPGAVTLFVRDRGIGFDVDAVDPAGRGIADSIVGRMARAGGSAVLRSVPGDGTEVELTMPRASR